MTDTNGQGPNMSPEQFGAYVQRVKNIDEEIHDLKKKIDLIAQPKWHLIGQLVAIGFVLFGGLGTYFYLPLRTTVDQNQEKAEKVSKDVGVLSTRIDFLTARVANLEAGQKTTDESIIRRSEHEQHWKRDADARNNIQRNVDKLENRLDILQGLDKGGKDGK